MGSPPLAKLLWLTTPTPTRSSRRLAPPSAECSQAVAADGMVETTMAADGMVETTMALAAGGMVETTMAAVETMAATASVALEASRIPMWAATISHLLFLARFNNLLLLLDCLFLVVFCRGVVQS